MKASLPSRLAPYLGLTFGCGLAAAKLSAAPTLLNGSFEDPALVGTNFESGSGANWAASAGTFVITNNFGFGTTPYGNQWEELASSSTDTQTINGGFALNTPCVLSLVASDVSGFSGDQLTLSVSGGATASQTFALPARANGQSAGALQFASYALTFTPTTAGPVVITLAAGSGGGGIALDNVQLLAVPEPSSWAWLGLGGLGTLGWRLHRRQRAGGPTWSAR